MYNSFYEKCCDIYKNKIDEYGKIIDSKYSKKFRLCVLGLNPKKDGNIDLCSLGESISEERKHDLWFQWPNQSAVKQLYNFIVDKFKIKDNELLVSNGSPIPSDNHKGSKLNEYFNKQMNIIKYLIIKNDIRLCIVLGSHMKIKIKKSDLFERNNDIYKLKNTKCEFRFIRHPSCGGINIAKGQISKFEIELSHIKVGGY